MESTVRIERVADQGRCVAHIDGRVVFVRFALPGELVRVVLDEPHDREERFWTGEVTEVLEASPERVEPAWPLAGPLAMGGGVGGADLVHVSLDGQRAWKATVIAEQMRRLGRLSEDAVGEVPVVRMPGDEAEGGLHWRTRIEMIVDEEGRPSMRRRGSHVRVPIDTMPLASRALLAAADAEHIWDGGFQPGSQIRIAAPEPRESVPAPCDTTSQPTQPSDAANLTNRTPLDDHGTYSSIETDKLAENPDGGAAAAPYAVLVDGELRAGSDPLTERVTLEGHDFTYRVAAGGFWQMHRQAPIALAGHALSLVRRVLDGASSAVLWDLYSGSGLFTLPLAVLAADCTRMLSVEGAKPAVINARRNLKAMGLSNVDARIGDVAATLAHAPADLARPDVVLLDPPRAGARAKVCRQIAAAAPRGVIYVACDPTSLARDTATLTSLGYQLADLTAFDIYPMTHHVETVALFLPTD